MEEKSNPVRTVTTTIRTKLGEDVLLPVRTAQKVPKDMVGEIVSRLRSVFVDNDVKIGENVYIADIDGQNICVIATSDTGKGQGFSAIL